MPRKTKRVNKRPGIVIESEQDEREIATILAALRYWQQNILDRGLYPENVSSHFDGGRIDPLESEEVDELCERLNFGG